MSSQELTNSLYHSAKEFIHSHENLSQKETRLSVLEQFKHLGIPTKKVEDYKYCNLSKYIPSKMGHVTSNKMNNSDEVMPSNYKVIFSNGVYQEESSSLPKGLSVEQEENTFKETYIDAMEALCDATAINYNLKIDKNVVLPLVTLYHDYYDLDEGINNCKVTITSESNSKSEFVEIYNCKQESKTYINAVTNLTLDANAKMTHQKVILGDIYNHYVSKVNASLKRDAHLNSQTLTTGPQLIRNNIYVSIDEKGAHATVNGLFATRSEQLNDNFSHIDHNAGHTTSEQVFKGILDDCSRGAFTGKIVIQRDSQLVDSSQLNKNLLLDKRAHIDTRPQLEVYADDVKCAHGATVGQISEEEVFYLESRGIEKTDAQKILCHAFAKEVFLSANNEDLTKWLEDKLFDHFEHFALGKIS